ncbi:rotatin-like [Arctopsyche grandis]|uniref:rotatin-like n=1 Tax=Arctopsyche grandis TaxID=121162 RepID=UPI00406D892C
MINNIPLKLSVVNAPNCTVGLLINISNMLYNSLILCNEVSAGMYESETFKILFSCLSLEIYPLVTKYSMCASICRTLCKATELSKKIIKVLVKQHNFIEDFIELFTNQYIYLNIQSPEIVAVYVDMWYWGFLLLGSLLNAHGGYSIVWDTISDFGPIDFFHSSIITLSDSRFKDVIPSSLYFLVNFFNLSYSYSSDMSVRLAHILDYTGVSKKKLNNYNDLFYDIDDIDIDDPDIDEFSKLNIKEIKSNVNHNSNSDFLEKSKNALLGEEFCFHLLQLYYKYNTSNIENKIYGLNLESVTTGLITIFGISSKARILAVNLKFTQHLIENLNEIYNILIMSIKPQDVRSGNKSHIIDYLSWTVAMICNLLNNCDAAKEACIESNLVSPINKLWPWILPDNKLLNHVLEMLQTFTNSCPKACNTMCATVGKKSLLVEIINVALREMNLVSRSHSTALLQDSLKILCTVSCHIHCRTIIVKSEIFACLNKIHPTITRGQRHYQKVVRIWDDFCGNMSKYPECQIKISEYLGVLCALCNQTANRLMLTAIRNCSFNSMNRPRYLASAELLHLFSIILTTPNIIPEKIYVCTAIWALCANNHKGKLTMKALGITSKLADCLHRLECEANENEFEIQFMTYVLNVIKAD